MSSIKTRLTQVLALLIQRNETEEAEIIKEVIENIEDGYTLQLTVPEVQSKINRVLNAEGLIKQLPKDHDGRNTWLLNFGISDEAKTIRETHKLIDACIVWNEETQSLNPVSSEPNY